MKNHKGFTLHEILVVIGILGIFVGLVYPSYQYFVRKGRIANAYQAMLDNAQFLERFYAQNRKFKQDTQTWAALPIMQTEYFCIKLQGSPNSVRDDSKYTMKAVALNQKNEPRVLLLNQDGSVQICESTTSSCSEQDFFKNPNSRVDSGCGEYL